MKLIHTGFALAAMAIIPGVADAGIMYWQVSGSTYQLPFDPSPGQINIPTESGSVVGMTSDYSATIAAVTLSNWATTPPTSSWLSQNHYEGTSLIEYDLTVTITDASSGLTQPLFVSGVAYASWTQLPNGSWTLSNEPGMGGGSSATMVLGTNLYSVWIADASSPSPNSTAPLVANVNVSVTALAAPEPATLILAAGGLPFARFFFRRRAKARS